MEGKKFYGLDHLRAVAILLVLMYHYRAFKHPSWIDTIGSVGWTGVDLFFVLSGFLISNQLFVEIKKSNTINLDIFFIKRFFRIVPPYLVTLFLYDCVPVFRERETLPPLWKFLTFTQNYALDVMNQGTFSHAWSLCIEEQFYLFLPLALIAFIRAGIFSYLKFGVILLIIISILLRLYSWHEFVVPNLNSPSFWKEWYMNIYYPTYTRFDGLAIGVLIGYFYQYSSRFKNILNNNGNILFLMGIIATVLSLWFCEDQASARASVFGFSLVAISYGMIVMGAISSSCIFGKKKLFVTSQLAVLSYSMYLTHKGIIHLTQLFVEKNKMVVSNNVLLLLCFIACIVASMFYRVSIEKISNIIKNKFLTLKNQAL